MKQNLRNAFILLSILFLTVAQGFAENIGGIEYTLNSSGKTATVTALTTPGKYTGEITVPSTVTSTDGNTYTVTSIGKEAFNMCTSLTKVTLPNTITSIGESAFADCKSLLSVNLPEKLKTIGSSAFSHCEYLSESETLVMPNSVISIGTWAFYYCYRLKGITLSTSLTSIPQCAFNYCRGLTSITIPESVTSIEANAFLDCAHLADILIPSPASNLEITGTAFSTTKFYTDHSDGLVYIGDKVLLGYKGTVPANTSITVKKGVQIIGEDAFLNQDNLQAVMLPESILHVGDMAFGQLLTNLKSITFLGKTPPTCKHYIGAGFGNLYCVDVDGYKSSLSGFKIKEISYTVPISSVGYSTFSAPVPTVIPDGVKAYRAILDEPISDGDGGITGVITFERIRDCIPAYCGVLLKGNAGSYTFTLAKQTVEPIGDNLLSETGYDVVKSGAHDYVLAQPKDHEVGMYLAKENIDIPVNKAFFRLATASNVTGYVFKFSTSTGINALGASNHQNIYYNLNGMREVKPQNGKLYIVNGKVTIK